MLAIVATFCGGTEAEDDTPELTTTSSTPVVQETTTTTTLLIVKKQPKNSVFLMTIQVVILKAIERYKDF